MSILDEIMKVIIDNRGAPLRERLRDRLERAALLRCDHHGEKIVAVTIHGRENGWFDATWTTCCDALKEKAHTIVRERC
jgi:hypothetical protein